MALLRASPREKRPQLYNAESRASSDARKRRTEVQRLAALLVAEGENPSSLPLDRAKQFEAIGPDLLLEFGTELAVVREEEVKGYLRTAAEIGPAWHATASSAASTVSKIPTHLKIDRNALIAGLPDARVFRFHEQKALPASARRAAAGVRPDDGTKGEMVREEVMLVPPEVPTRAAAAPTPPTSITMLLEWAIGNGVHAKPATDALAAVRSLAAGQSMTAYQFGVAAHARVNATRDLNFFFKERMRVEPVGLLHLERLELHPRRYRARRAGSVLPPQPLRGGQHQP